MDLRNLIKDEMANLASESMQIDLGLYKNENLKMFFFSISKGKKLELVRHIAKKIQRLNELWQKRTNDQK